MCKVEKGPAIVCDTSPYHPVLIFSQAFLQSSLLGIILTHLTIFILTHLSDSKLVYLIWTKLNNSLHRSCSSCSMRKCRLPAAMVLAIKQQVISQPMFKGIVKVAMCRTASRGLCRQTTLGRQPTTIVSIITNQFQGSLCSPMVIIYKLMVRVE